MADPSPSEFPSTSRVVEGLVLLVFKSKGSGAEGMGAVADGPTLQQVKRARRGLVVAGSMEITGQPQWLYEVRRRLRGIRRLL